MAESTTIWVKKATKDRLKEYGKKMETYDELINRLLSEINGKPVRTTC